MSKKVSSIATKRVTSYFLSLPADERWQWMTTDWKANTQIARLRRLMVKEANSQTRRKLREVASR